MADPPSLAGAVQLRSTLVLPAASAVKSPGTVGTLGSVVAYARSEPDRFVPSVDFTVIVYSVAGTRSSIVYSVPVMRADHQIAQKLHAVSDPHDPPIWVNDRPRDVPDLLLLRDLVREAGAPTLAEIRAPQEWLARTAQAGG